MKKNIITFIILTILSKAVIAEEKTNKSQWEFSAEVYGLILNIDGQSKIKDMNNTSLNVSPDLILDSLDKGLMIHTEGLYKNTYGYSIDYSFMDLSNGKSISLIGNKERTTVKGNVFQGVLESKIFKRYQYDFGSIDYMAGIRWWDTKADGEINIGNSLQKGELVNVDWVDYVVGARYIKNLNSDFKFYMSGDIGVGKNTDLTYQIMTGIRHNLTNSSELHFGYKSTWVDYQTNEFKYDTKSHGLVIGYNFVF